MAAKLGPMIEIRVGCRTQDLPVFVRMIDRDSKWGMDNGLKSVITATLAFSVMGYRKLFNKLAFNSFEFKSLN